MPPGDDRDGGVIPGSGFDFDVEFFLDSLLQSDGDAFLVHIPLAACHGLGIDVAQHFEPVGGLADQGAERNGDRQADHARAGDAHAHGVLEDIGREAGDDAFGFRTEDFGGFRHAEGDGDGLRAADGRYDLAVD